MVTIALLIRRKSIKNAPEIEDEEEAYHYDIQKEETVWRRTIFKGAPWSCHTFNTFIVNVVYMDRPSTGNWLLSLENFTMLYLSLSWLPYFSYRISSFILSIRFMKPIPKCQCQEVREFTWVWWMKQKSRLANEENYGIIIKLSNYWFPLIAIF